MQCIQLSEKGNTTSGLAFVERPGALILTIPNTKGEKANFKTICENSFILLLFSGLL